MSAKYVIFKSPVHGEFPVVFPSSINHSFITHCVLSEYPGIVPVRAGFVDVENGTFDCHGNSISLKLQSDPKIDDLLIKATFSL